MPEAMVAPRPVPETSAERLLSVQELRVHYGAVAAIKGVSLHVGPGEVVALLGANGAGKTTMLRTISGLIRPRSGAIRFQGVRIDRMPPSRIVRLGIAHSPEGRRIFGSLSVAENLRLGAAARVDRSGVEEDRERIYTLFPILRERMHQQAGTLSGGEQQMLALPTPSGDRRVSSARRAQARARPLQAEASVPAAEWTQPPSWAPLSAPPWAEGAGCGCWRRRRWGSSGNGRGLGRLLLDRFGLGQLLGLRLQLLGVAHALAQAGGSLAFTRSTAMGSGSGKRTSRCAGW